MQTVKKLQLRRKVHQLSPVVILGQHGLTPQVQLAISEALDAHELIKIRVNAEDKAQRKLITDEILSHQGAELIQSIGHVLAIYRQAKRT